MKTKILQQAEQAYSINLPVEWINNSKLKVGDDIEIIPEGENLIIKRILPLEQILKYDPKGKPQLRLNSIGGTAVNTPTQEEYDTLMQIYECGGWKWVTGKLPTEYDVKITDEYWCVDAGKAGQTRYHNYEGSFECMSRGDYMDCDWDIITPQQFYNIQKITPGIIKEINQWYDANKPNRASKGT